MPVRKRPASRKTCESTLECVRCDEPIKVGLRMVWRPGESGWSHPTCPAVTASAAEVRNAARSYPNSGLFAALVGRQLG